MAAANTNQDFRMDVSGEMNVPRQEEKPQFDFASILRLQRIPTPLELLQITRQYIRPWSTFLNTNNYKPAASMPRLSSRFVRNITYFQSNYICVFIVLMIYCLITSPLIMIVLGAAAYLSNRIRKSETSVTFFGQQLSPKHQIIAVNVAAVPILFLVGAGSILFWTLGASCFVIALHAIFYNIDAVVADDADGFLAEVV